MITARIAGAVIVAFMLGLVFVAYLWFGSLFHWSAQGAELRQPLGYTACSADRYRYCQKIEGIPAIVSCLQEHRQVISKACDAFLKEHGQ